MLLTPFNEFLFMLIKQIENQIFNLVWLKNHGYVFFLSDALFVGK
jgi:hypothetical protein